MKINTIMWRYFFLRLKLIWIKKLTLMINIKSTKSYGAIIKDIVILFKNSFLEESFLIDFSSGKHDLLFKYFIIN